METVEYKNFINSKWVAFVTGKTLENRNPADSSAHSRNPTSVTSTRPPPGPPSHGDWCRLPSAPRSSPATGNGHREAGQVALDVFSEWKAVYEDFSGILQKAQIDA
jgi:hypothetical protein